MLIRAGTSGNLRQRNAPGLSYRVRFAQLSALGGENYPELLRETESSHLFLELRNARIIRYESYRGFEKCFRYRPLERDIPSRYQADVEGFLEGREDIIRLIKKMGQGRFKDYFLSGNYFGEEELCAGCGLSPGEARAVIEFVDKLFVQNRFACPPSGLNANELKAEYYRVGRISGERGKYVFEFYSLDDWRRRYRIDYENLNKFKGGLETESGKRELDELVSTLEMINKRKRLLHNIISYIMTFQSGYLETGLYYRLKPLTIRKLAARLNVCPSNVCRIIRGKTVDLPRGEEKEMKFFFPNRKKVVTEYMRSIDNAGVPARKLKEAVKNDLGLDIPPRTVNYYREKIDNE